MIKICLLYLLLIVSIVFPPLLLVSGPLAYIETRRVFRARRQIIQLATMIEDERRTDAIVKFFR